MRMTRVAFVDDNLEILASVIDYFHNNSSDTIASTYSDVESFISTQETIFDIIFLDIILPGISGLEALPLIKNRYPNAEVIMFTVQEDADSLLSAFQNGATGYLLKDASLDSLIEYIKIIRNGGSAISAKMAQYLIKKLTIDHKPLEILNDKEYQILELLAEGWSYKLIADKSNLSIDGVRFYIKRIYRALNINSKGEALRLYYKGKL